MSQSQLEERATTRERLLDAAWAILRTEGLRAATSRRIAAGAGANLGSITYYFESKDKLVAQAAVAKMQSWTKPLSNALLADERDAAGRTPLVIATLLAHLQDAQADARAWLEVVLARDVAEAVRDAMRHHLTTFQEVVADVMARRQQRGEIPESVTPIAMAGMFTAFAIGLLAQDSIGANPAPMADVVGQLLALLTPPTS